MQTLGKRVFSVLNYFRYCMHHRTEVNGAKRWTWTLSHTYMCIYLHAPNKRTHQNHIPYNSFGSTKDYQACDAIHNPIKNNLTSIIKPTDPIRSKSINGLGDSQYPSGIRQTIAQI